MVFPRRVLSALFPHCAQSSGYSRCRRNISSALPGTCKIRPTFFWRVGLFRGPADKMVATGASMPKSEVAPVCDMLLQTYLVTKGRKYLDAATPFLETLFACNGQLPDYHFNDLDIFVLGMTSGLARPSSTPTPSPGIGALSTRSCSTNSPGPIPLTPPSFDTRLPYQGRAFLRRLGKRSGMGAGALPALRECHIATSPHRSTT